MVESEVNWNKPWDRREEFWMELVLRNKEAVAFIF